MTLLLVDGNGLACQFWYANALEVPERFANTVQRLLSEHGDPSEMGTAGVVVCWDSPRPTWRHEIFPQYKANRCASKPELLSAALRDCRRLARFEHVEAPGFEADDCVATLTWRAVEAGEDVLILSRDKDFAQLVGEHCRMIDAAGVITDAAEVERKFGVPPWRMRHFLSWAGDASDGLPGMKGVGPKRAIAHALAGEIGDPLTWELVQLATVPGLSL